MYRACIFCSAALGSNDAIERFPVGRSLAFDGEKGRLWAVCLRCARWNLAPIEERWEAIEEAERLFRDTRLRVQSENIGLARLPDGTRLVRVGQALAGEMAAWRYGESLVRRRRRYLAVSGGVLVLSLGGSLFSLTGTGIGLLVGMSAPHLVSRARDLYRTRSVVQSLRAADTPDGRPVTLYRRHLERASLVASSDGGIGIHLPTARDRPFWGPVSPLTLEGESVRTLLGRAMVHLNERGARRRGLQLAVERLSAAGSPDAYLRDAAEQKRFLFPGHGVHERAEGLALEMALHEETERRALDGELGMLEAMWRQAEEIAGIADRLPDLPAPDPPRLITEG